MAGPSTDSIRSIKIGDDCNALLAGARVHGDSFVVNTSLKDGEFHRENKKRILRQRMEAIRF
jgi:hypothetical protein